MAHEQEDQEQQFWRGYYAVKTKEPEPAKYPFVRYPYPVLPREEVKIMEIVV